VGGTGSGFVWGDGSYVVTNAHVVAAGDRFAVTFGDGQAHECSLVGMDPEGDIAVLKIKLKQRSKVFTSLPLGSSSELIVGQSVFAIGNPFGLDQTLTVGIISGLGRELPRQEGGGPNATLQDLIQTDAAINPGNSGGPLLDSQGKVIGVNTAILSPSGASAGIGFALPIDQVKTLVDQIITFGAVKRPKLGIGMAPDQVYAQIRSQAGHLGPGVLVLQAEEPALSAGVRPTTRDMTSNGQITFGDIIVAIDGAPTPSTEALLAQMDKKRVGQAIKLRLQRGRSTVEIPVILQERHRKQ